MRRVTILVLAVVLLVGCGRSVLVDEGSVATTRELGSRMIVKITYNAYSWGISDEKEIDLIKKTIAWKYDNQWDESFSRDIIMDLNDKAISHFQCAPVTLGPDKWEARYELDNPPADSTEWTMVIIYDDGSRMATSGYAVFPDKWEMFIVALRKLMGRE